MAENTFLFEILTPQRQFFSGQIEALTFQAHDGEWTILKDHAPMVAVLRPGVVSIKQEGAWKTAINSEGYMEVGHSGVILFAQTCEWPEEVDVNRAERTRLLAEEKLRQAKSLAEYHTSRVMLARAMARLRNSGKNVNLD
jgi:F-type H+-transporting ATPase subunit epsilon